MGEKMKRIWNYIRKIFRRPIHLTVNVYETSPNQVLKNRNIIITGGGRGLGYAIAKRSVAEGARVLITGRNEENLKKAAKEIGCFYAVFDVKNIANIGEFLKNAESLLGGKVDSLVSNAGISLHEGDFRNVTEDGWNDQVDTNLKGNYFLVSEFIQYLERQSDTRGNIVVITSERSKRSDDIPYGLTKTATNSFVQAFAAKVIDKNIRVNAVAPGVTASDMTHYKVDGNLYAEWQPSGRIFRPEEVAEVVNFLLNDVSNCISGEIIACDQGRYISRW